MPSREWQFRVQDILDAIARIQRHTRGLTFRQFRTDEKTLDAVARNFIVIGEAATHVPDDVTSRFAAVPWRKMRDMRNIAVHHYWGVDLDVVWQTIQEDLPPLVPLLQSVLRAQDHSS